MTPSGNGNMFQILQGERLDGDTDGCGVIDRRFWIIRYYNDDPTAYGPGTLHQHAQDMMDNCIRSPLEVFHYRRCIFLQYIGKSRKRLCYILDGLLQCGLKTLERFCDCSHDFATIECENLLSRGPSVNKDLNSLFSPPGRA